MTTYLNVPFRERNEAKAKGARWDAEARKWFVPVGRDLESFASWLPVNPAKLAVRDLTDPSKGVPLSQLLAGVATAVEQAFRQGVWTTAEVMKVDGNPHVYLELAERDAGGGLIAKARAIVWSRDVDQVLGTFQAATGVRLAAGIKVLIRARPEFSAQYGLTLHVDAIDPSYTLGDLEARKRQIREQLKEEGVFERNRQLPTPWDYRSLLVVSPPRAAGLGDFARDADRLQQHGLAEATYAHSRFEGEGAPGLIREAINAALAAWPGPELPDAIVIIRGGGAVNDLAWLNDYELARLVCLSPVPVLTGIGHERDSTILDEVAHQSFDTPSKAIAGIEALIVRRAREANAAFDNVAGLALRQLQIGRSGAARLDAEIQRHAQRTLHEATQGSLRALSDVRAGAGGALAGARAMASALRDQVETGVLDTLTKARQGTGDAWRHVAERVGLASATQRNRAYELSLEVARLARNSLRRGREAAEAAFREVVAQGPEKTLQRGFAVVRKATGDLVTNAAAVAEAEELQLHFKDGSIKASVHRGEEKR